MDNRLAAYVTVARADFEVDVALEVPAGECLAILGENGAGKSTLLHALAGLTPLDAGEVRLGARLLERAGGERLRPEQRRVGLLDQKPRLFPHLTIARNIAFGPRSQGIGRRESRQIALDWLRRVGLEARADAKPHELSGGQQQRVAIARAFASQPHVLLLDEPFAALDAESVPTVRRMLVDELARTSTTSVVVTHDLADAWQLAGSCLVVARGRVIDSGSPAELAVRPRHPFTAALAGYGVVRGTHSGGGLEVGGRRLAGTVEGDIGEGHAAIGILAPSAVRVSATDGSWPAVLTAVSARAGVVKLEDGAGFAAEIGLDEAVRLAGGRLPASGDRLWFTPEPAHLRIVSATMFYDA
ncbi:sulfate/molybdate ABC transporter ATP-binding protein [Paramicrobacterium humi]|uniref:sulfate/molybdate ABC transporter ATP-binding protein n=1 Tax=Paramicrobacterium humi TaxID=640635 RepID=UPI0015A02C39|nr:ATP-binding cassette domain-containing protein [Microbacterium humi]